MLTQDDLKKHLNYNNETGIFIRIKSRRKNKIGTVCKSLDKDGYIRIYINKKPYMAHRLVWLYIYGEWPICQIDHINRIKIDNRISNLRNATHQQNGMNRGVQKNNLSGIKGVRIDKRDGKIYARIKINGKQIHLGCFKTIQDASYAYNSTAKKHFGEYYSPLNTFS